MTEQNQKQLDMALWITAEARKLEALKVHKKGLMQQLFPSPEVTQGTKDVSPEQEEGA